MISNKFIKKEHRLYSYSPCNTASNSANWYSKSEWAKIKKNKNKKNKNKKTHRK